MSQSDTTSVRVSVETWSVLNRRKSPGDSFDDVIREALGIEKTEEEIEDG